MKDKEGDSIVNDGNHYEEIDFSCLIDEEEGFVAVAPEIIAKPPPPKRNSKKDKKKKNEIDEDEEFLALMKEQPQKNGSKAKTVIIRNEKPKLNIAQELMDKYCEMAFEDSTQMGKNPSPNKFIAKRKNWPNTVPASFKVTEENSEHFNIKLTEYAVSMMKLMEQLEESKNIPMMLTVIHQEPFAFPIVTAVARVSLYQREFSEATDFALRLTYLIQQSLPAKFVFGKSKFVHSEGSKAMQSIISFLATFAFRRGCYETSTSLWKFGIESFDEDPLEMTFCAAIPALYSGDSRFIARMLESDRKVNGIPIRMIPDYSICDALFDIQNEDKLSRIISLWPIAFGNDENDVPVQLATLQAIFKKRATPFLEKEPYASAIRKAKLNHMNVTEEYDPIYNEWSSYTRDINVCMVYEEASLPVGS